MAEEEYIGCISCMGLNDLCDLFAPHGENIESYAKILDNCFNIKVVQELTFICSQCVQKLEEAAKFKDKTIKSMSMMHANKEEEYLDESILAEADTPDFSTEPGVSAGDLPDNKDDTSSTMELVDVSDQTCLHCNKTFESNNSLKKHLLANHTVHHGNEKESPLTCDVCDQGIESRSEMKDHIKRRHCIEENEGDQKEFACHFCDNSYTSRKACYTHLRMKHGLKLTNDQTPKHAKRERKKCHVCGRDFSQKQILNKHLWKEHGLEIEKRKALDCPLCEERVSYGAYFSDHLLAEHDIEEDVEELQFLTMDDFLMFKSSVQEATKFRFRKTTATKQTIEGLRSHYMCSQSGVYVYQGKGIRAAPERQIYKTGKACPAHMVVTEAVDCVKVVFHKTHVGHGACPYYEPRETKRQKTTDNDTNVNKTRATDKEGAFRNDSKTNDSSADSRLAWICDTCGMVFFEVYKFRQHVKTHNMFEGTDGVLSKRKMATTVFTKTIMY